MTNTNLLELAVKAALEAGDKTLKFYHQEMDIVVKEDNSPLTQADLESNSAIISCLEETGLPILSEENKVVSYSERSDWPRFWLIGFIPASALSFSSMPVAASALVTPLRTTAARIQATRSHRRAPSSCHAMRSPTLASTHRGA